MNEQPQIHAAPAESVQPAEKKILILALGGCGAKTAD